MSEELTGRCQCGGVRYTLSEPPFFVVVCHCTECQRLSSSAFSMSTLIDREHFHVTGELALFERSTTSGAVARCFFCPTCGNRVYHDAGDDEPRIRVKLPLEQRDRIHPRIQLWTSVRQPWLTGLTGGLRSLPTFETQVFDPPVIKRRIALQYALNAARIGIRALGLVCIGVVGWQMIAG